MMLVPATHEEIAALAFQYWLEEGQPEGRHEIHWQRAYMTLLEIPAAETIAAAATDVSLIGGVGPKIKEQLASEGLTTLAQIAALSDDELAAIDAKLGFKGRSVREDWLAQARELVTGAAPRAKTDKARA
jgi:predicted RecB family nuclease